MKFWGVEVKGGESLKVKPEEDFVIHISQAALGESKKDKTDEPVPVFVKVGNKKLVLGTLSSQKIPQLSLDLVFEKEFELSHNWKNGSVYFCGYQTDVSDEDFDESEYEDAELPLVVEDKGRVEPKAENTKPAATKAAAGKPASFAKPNAKLVEPSKDNKPEVESDESDDDEGSEEEGESEEGMSIDEDEDEDDDNDDDEDEEDNESEDEETPKKAESGKKRPNDSAIKTPVHTKKAKAATPQKTDGKKGGYTATPYPAKNAGKAAANAKPHTPKPYAAFKSHTKARKK